MTAGVSIKQQEGKTKVLTWDPTGKTTTNCLFIRRTEEDRRAAFDSELSEGFLKMYFLYLLLS